MRLALVLATGLTGVCSRSAGDGGGRECKCGGQLSGGDASAPGCADNSRRAVSSGAGTVHPPQQSSPVRTVAAGDAQPSAGGDSVSSVVTLSVNIPVGSSVDLGRCAIMVGQSSASSTVSSGSWVPASSQSSSVSVAVGSSGVSLPPAAPSAAGYRQWMVSAVPADQSNPYADGLELKRSSSVVSDEPSGAAEAGESGAVASEVESETIA